MGSSENHIADGKPTKIGTRSCANPFLYDARVNGSSQELMAHCQRNSTNEHNCA